jgi:23S rRNA (adenine2030-N6)-methyltransferase
MLSYRHSFHAGNFADVLKHIVLVEILEYLTQKEKPFEYIDTHAGAGLFDLQSDRAKKLNESDNGIRKLDSNDWPELERYFEVIARYNSNPSLEQYPGSPLIAQHFLRRQDKAWLYELHPEDYQLLKNVIAPGKRTKILQENGFKHLLGLLPPASRRALVLIDPSYEIKTDYQTVVRTISKAHKRFSSGIYAVWYPVVDRLRIDQMENDFISSGIKNIQRFELGLAADTNVLGMTASGMVVINPPWTLMEKMNQLLPKLVKAFGNNQEAFFRSDVLVEE